MTKNELIAERRRLKDGLRRAEARAEKAEHNLHFQNLWPVLKGMTLGASPIAMQAPAPPLSISDGAEFFDRFCPVPESQKIT